MRLSRDFVSIFPDIFEISVSNIKCRLIYNIYQSTWQIMILLIIESDYWITDVFANPISDVFCLPFIESKNECKAAFRGKFVPKCGIF